jgi:hypothetical protein
MKLNSNSDLILMSFCHLLVSISDSYLLIEAINIFSPSLFCIKKHSNSVTRNYFENLVRALETGLNDVGPSNSQAGFNQAACSKSTSSKSLAPTKSKSSKNRSSGAATSSRSGSSRGMDDSIWTCDSCTCTNPKTNSHCQACDRHR